MTHRTPPNAYGKHWAWVWWSISIPIGEQGAGSWRGGQVLTLQPLADKPVNFPTPLRTAAAVPPPCAAAELLGTPEIMCRAWDSSMNTQPNSFTWNVMGMMNNACYRVKVHPRPAAGERQRESLRGRVAELRAGGGEEGGRGEVTETHTSASMVPFPIVLQLVALRCTLSTPPSQPAPWAGG